MNPPPTARPALASIPVDLPCFGCRYNLRTLSVESVCPECGVPIRRTVDHGWLIFADPAWLWRVRRGLSSLLFTLLVWPVGIAGIVVYAVFIAAGEPDEVIMSTLTLAISAAFIALWLFGVWGVTSPEPLSNPGRIKPNLGKWIRALHIAAIVVVIVGVCASSGVQEFTAPDAMRALSIFGVAGLGWSAYALSFLLLLAYLRRLSRRVTKSTLRKLLTFMLWGGIGLTVLTIIIAAASMYLIGAGGGGAWAPVSPSSAPSPTTMSVRVQPTAVSVSWSTPTTAPASGMTLTTTTAPVTTTGPVAVMPITTSFGMMIGLAFAAFYLFVLVWGAGWLLTLISFRRILKQTIRENASTAYAAWLNPISPPPNTL